MLGAAFVAGLAVAVLASVVGAPSQTSLPPGRSTQAVAGMTDAASVPALQTRSPAPLTSQVPQDTGTPIVTPAPQQTTRADAPARQGPADAVLAFYVAVATHDWETATALWSPDMQLRYPPEEYIVDRFSATQRIQISGLELVRIDRSAGSARVALTVVEYRTVEPSPQRFVGAWDLVRIDGRWLLDAPRF